ncbi:retinol dehydrogenase 2-like [Cynoglossus semilaevis]|nr:retinol dehydrogenase 2-like [Cynoglossus semilaevis]
MAPFGVKVVCVEPGFFKTDMSDLELVKKNFKRLWDRLPQNVKDDYGHSFLGQICQRLDDKVKNLFDKDLMKVVRCMEHGICAVHPRTRYSPGWDSKFFWLPLSYAPTWISDRIFLRNSPKPKKSVL